ncbi:MAG TPA: RNA polymerase sigma factor [Bacteroidetes bacterium]|nr:RNA polymerase sigma factor [Bacteroidota bacterium]
MRALGGNEAQERREARELVHKALAQMEPKFRSVIVLRMLEGYSSQEAAQILQVPLGTILSRLTRARGKLKEILKKMIA